MNENRHGATARRKNIVQSHVSRRRNQILTSGVAFFVALRSEDRAEQKFAPDLRGFTLTVTTPQWSHYLGNLLYSDFPLLSLLLMDTSLEKSVEATQ